MLQPNILLHFAIFSALLLLIPHAVNSSPANPPLISISNQFSAGSLGKVERLFKSYFVHQEEKYDYLKSLNEEMKKLKPKSYIINKVQTILDTALKMPIGEKQKIFVEQAHKMFVIEGNNRNVLNRIKMLLDSESASFSDSNNFINSTSKNQAAENILEFSEIVTKILEINGGNIEKQLEKCRKVSAAIAWSILWELELLKKNNVSSYIPEDENKSENSKKQKKIDENVGRLFFEIKTTTNFKSCQDDLNEILQNLRNGINYFVHSKNIRNIINLGVLKGNWETTKMDKFMEEFLAKNKFELELALEFAEFNKILGTNLAKEGERNFHLIVSKELVKIISELHHLITKLNEQNDIRKIGKIANDLTEKVRQLNNEWIKFGIDGKKNESIKNLHEKVGNMIKYMSWDFSALCSDIESWEKNSGGNLKIYFEEMINVFAQKLKYWINFLHWSVMPAEEEAEIDMARIELQQLIVKLALLRRFILNEFSQKNDKRMKEKLEQKIKWILRRRQRLEYQLQNDEQRKNFNSKFEHILGKIREILKNSAPAGGWADHSFKQQMRQYYYGNEEKQTVKIRVTIRPGQLFRHSFVTLGNEYEYDYLGKYAPRRRIFKKWIDEKLDENNEQKEAKPIEGLEKFSVTEADTIFFDMPKKGWIPSNHDRRKMRNCTSFVYEFIFHLNGGKCPAEEKWPQPFLDVDEKTPTIAELYLNHKMVSVFSEEYANNYRQKFIKREEEGSKECALKELEIQILMIKGEKWRLMEQKGKKVKEENEKSNAQMLLPAIVVYDTGRFYNFRHYTTEERNCPFDFTEPLNIQEHLVKETETAEAILYSALLKVNLCKVDGMPRAFVNNLFLLDSKMEYLVHEFGGANLFEENSGGHHLFKYEFGETQQEKMNDINKLCGIYRDEMIMKQKIEN